LTVAEQGKFLEQTSTRFFEAPAGMEKQSAMTTLSSVYWKSENHSFWQPFFSQVAEQLKVENAEQTTVDNPRLKYNFTLLGLVKSALIREIAAPWVQPTLDEETQKAVAWALGRDKTAENLTRLSRMVQD